jgi:hypothetical protein
MKQTILYVLGAGRSGTTLLDIILGNSDDIKSCGELLRFVETKGVPPGTEEGSDVYEFWDGIKKCLNAKYNEDIDYNNLFISCRKVETHRWFLRTYLNMVPNNLMNIYGIYNERLYDCIFETIDTNVLIDSSKWPGRLLALSKSIKNYDIKVVYLVRSPSAVIRSFGIKDIEQPYKGFVTSNIYYFIINFACNLVLYKLTDVKSVKVRYEDLLLNPGEQLKRIEDALNIDLSRSIDIIENNRELVVDKLFEGNRIRKNKSIFLKRIANLPEVKINEYFTMLINGIWWNKP